MATVVALHAHPDDEALLTGGTLAMLAGAGHDVLVVFATDGALGLSDGLSERGRGPALGLARRIEGSMSTAALGLPPPHWLGYADSGEGSDRPPGAFADADVEEVAGRLAALLTDRGADLLMGYDATGGYGHPDHRQVHAVAARAAVLAGTPRVLEATVDRDALRRVVRMLRAVPRLPASFTAERLGAAYLPRAELTHRLDVRPQARRKRAALAAHVSQTRGGSDTRTLELLLRLPEPLFVRVLGYEWFREVGVTSGPPLRTDLDLGPALRGGDR